MTSLYKLSEDYLALQNAIDDDLPAEAIADTLEAIEGEFEDKAHNLILHTRNVDAHINAISDEIKRLQKMKSTRVDHVKACKKYLISSMIRTGIKKITGTFNISIASPRDTVVITDLSALPDKYVEVEAEIKPIKAELLKALKGGEKVMGAELGKSEPSLRVT